MKIILCLIFILNFSLGLSQTNWNEFISDLEEINLPIKIDSVSKPKNVLVSKNIAMNFLINSATILNKEKPESMQFEVDSTLISIYKQWDNLDLNKKDTIDVYSPIGGGLIYCNRKIEINENLVGVVWLYYSNMGKSINFMVTSGLEYWLFIYDKKGFCQDFIQIAKKQRIGVCDKCLFYKECLLYNSKENELTLTISQINISLKDSSRFFDKKTKMNESKTKETFILTKEGKFFKKSL